MTPEYIGYKVLRKCSDRESELHYYWHNGDTGEVSHRRVASSRWRKWLHTLGRFKNLREGLQ